MRHIIVIFFIAILFGCSSTGIDNPEKRNENWSWFVDEKTGEGNWIPVADSNDVKSGLCTFFYNNGKIFQKGKIVNGKYKDTMCYYDLYGKLIKYFLLKNDTVIEYYINDGPYKGYYQTGEIADNGIVKNHDRGENWIRYYKNGKIKWIEKLNERTGLTTWYYENGQMSGSTYHIKGVGHGVSKTWYENGKLKEESNWKNAIQDGTCKTYYENGQIEQSSNWIEGKREGIREGWYENGQKQFSEFRKNDLCEGVTTSWYQNGNIKNQGNYKNGVKNGKFIFHHENGKLKTEGNCENGNQVGQWNWYDENGKLFQKDFYENGILTDVKKYK